MIKEKEMNPISIRNISLKYFVITYLLDNKKNVFFILSSDEISALTYFFIEAVKNKLIVKSDQIISIKALEIMNPN